MIQKPMPGLAAFVLIAAGCATVITGSDESKPAPEDVKAITKKVADWQIETFEDQAKYRGLSSKGWNAGLEKHHEADWTSGALYTGMDLWRAIADDPDKYTQWLKAICERNGWRLYGEEVFKNIYHADAHLVGLTYLSLYEEFNDPVMLNPTKETFDFILENPSDAGLEYKTKEERKENPEEQHYLHRWGWCDALYMAPPVWARLARVTGEKKYLEFMDKEYHATYDVLWDDEERFFFRDTRFLTQSEENGEKVFWSRGNGWVFGGLALMIPDMPTDWEGRAFYVDLFKQMAESIKNCQREDGTWNMGLLGGVEGYPVKETSGTAFFTFGLAWGVNNGLLHRNVYEPVVYKAWNALTDCVTEDGLLGYVQPIGASPGDSFPDKTEIYGSGAFLAAGSEVYKLVGGTVPESEEKLCSGPFLATGIKIGEVDQTSAIIWARLTRNSQRVGFDAPVPEFLYLNDETGEYEPMKGRKDRIPKVIYPEGTTVETIEGATPGASGQVRIQYRKSGAQDWQQTDWAVVDPAKDYTVQLKLSGLTPGADYELRVDAAPLKSETVTASIAGSFKTAPDKDTAATVNFIVTTGTSYGDKESDAGYQFYVPALKLDPEFFVHTGDILYYDYYAKTKDLALWGWGRMYSLPNHVDFHRQIASYFIKDDHDTWMNDCYPGMKTRFMGEFTYKQGTEIFLWEFPMSGKTYRTVRWGKDLQIWMVEGRDFRSPNDAPDGPDKTIWGKEQMEWFKSTVEASDATFKVLISPTPIVGPDRMNKKDNHANSGFAYEGALLREFIARQKNMVSVCGDRHWQYVSKDRKTGMLEFSCGPGSHAHAGGWTNEDRFPEHLYLNVCGGFLEGSVDRDGGEPRLVFRHYDPDGKLLNEHVLTAK